MKLKDLCEKAQTGYSNTMYNNIDKKDGQYVVFNVDVEDKTVYAKFDRLEDAINQRDRWNIYGWPIIEAQQPNVMSILNESKDKIKKLTGEKRKKVKNLARRVKHSRSII